jgi:hypothetical protein
VKHFDAFGHVSSIWKTFTSRPCLVCLAVAASLATACSQGVGEGSVKSDRLYISNCWNGPFDLGPNFFGAIPFSKDVISIRVQRGDDNQEVSDGLNVLVNDVKEIRSSTVDQGVDGGVGLGEDIEVGLPTGVTPPGMPIRLNEHPPVVSLTLYLQDTCHLQNGTVYSVAGTINFTKLFSGDANETNSDDRLTEASFDATFADPRDMNADYTFDENVTSHVAGWFKFYFQRGQPAQPFP